MFCAGDEFLHTQGGNNNPYNQDNETTWLDWDRLDSNRDVHRFFQRMIAFRVAHPTLCRSRFWREDVRWYGEGKDVDMSHDSRHFAFYLDGESELDDDIYTMINAGEQDLLFTIQEGGAKDWLRVVDTSLKSPYDIREPGSEVALRSTKYRVKARSVVVWIRRRQG
jgi:glycogen operon protein